MNVTLRPWRIEDASFVARTRNRPELRQWFRQEHDINAQEQRNYMLLNPQYHGHIILNRNEPVGVCGVHFHGKLGELCIAAPIEYHEQAIPLLEQNEGYPPLEQDVFAKNPTLGLYIHKLGFKVQGVKEKQYYKQGIGFIDTVQIYK